MFKTSILLAIAASAHAFAPAALPLTTARRGATTSAVSGLSMQRLGSNKAATLEATSAVSGLSMQRLGSNKAATLEDGAVLTKELFTKLDVDGSGSIDINELRQVVPNTQEVQALMKRVDLNGDGEMDYAEYERLMAMSKNSDEQGGNLYVRNALNLGLLKKGSVLEDCVMVGNKGFDPLNCATSMDVLNYNREAELKHGRLAMLAAVGWPVSELVQPVLAKAVGAPDLLAYNEKAPSVLNGGLDYINPLFFMAVLIFTATVESVALNIPKGTRIPGDLGFDPLSLYTGKTEDVKRDLELKELNNGRLAMLAITYFAVSEFITKQPVA
mmetsp:Transcript_35497/g.83104  ORF Transcript_35497/g.83104 Transcript_35497/m.83104 type:complete len:328 (-) Transcript_35497:138-1121(-)|eukprot:CAMPEP_0172009496 /NCGR_PEP_ID=MMETSP1041-20130122/7215_1 /TAXON_ID=464988 /ORGANISM="Hemiselmis andersenii, Strain CCMP439" /LENGTH=327 /DNA_ID=CAMNT_0012663769 /DNA_START=39 /DNA_END=1022 /DNA_ORIENTATION=-